MAAPQRESEGQGTRRGWTCKTLTHFHGFGLFLKSSGEALKASNLLRDVIRFYVLRGLPLLGVEDGSRGQSNGLP